MGIFRNHIKNETLDKIKTSLEILWQRMVGASRVRCGESGTPSTIVYTRWSSRRYELGCDAPVDRTMNICANAHGERTV